jgi:LysM repeat protein
VEPQPDVLLAVNREAAPAVVPAMTTEEVVHRVKRGETLSAIARRYDTTVADLREWNGIKGNTIQIGQRLTVVVNRPIAVATN